MYDKHKNTDTIDTRVTQRYINVIIYYGYSQVAQSV